MARFVTTLLLALTLAVPQPVYASSSCGPSAGSGPQAVCESAATSDIWFYFWMTWMNVVVSGADLGITFREKPPSLPVQPINLAHHVLAGVTILGGVLELNSGDRGAAHTLLVVGLTSEAVAVVGTLGTVLRHRKQRRLERRIEQGR